MKKLLILSLTALAIIAGISCSSKKKLYIYNWSYYIPDDVVAQFEKENGVKVIYDTYSSNEEMFTKIKAGGTGYDITFPSADYVSIMIKEGMLSKLDKAALPNLVNLDPVVRAKATYDPNNEYSAPYMMGASGIAVNKKYVSSYKRDWSIYTRSDLKGRMTILDEPREVIGNAMKSLGYSVNSTNPAEIEKGKNLVLEWKKNIQKFDSESFAKGFASGEFWVVNCYIENIYSEADDELKKNIDFFIPAAGSSLYIDNMVMLKDAPNKGLALKFINFIHRPDVYAQIVDFFNLPSINAAATKLIKSKPLYTLKDIDNCELQLDIGDKIELYNKAWQQIRIGE